ncbi:hypothetical protein AB6A40_001459 [Gnathostoma spinigerum]|uniref:Ubiquitin carboxyl-terminal hydrolase n=1 Tax=Gnathostoma spinigerum TaxID=75299 RepID=A0ABD6E480_9BILA
MGTNSRARPWYDVDEDMEIIDSIPSTSFVRNTPERKSAIKSISQFFRRHFGSMKYKNSSSAPIKRSTSTDFSSRFTQYGNTPSNKVKRKRQIALSEADTNRTNQSRARSTSSLARNCRKVCEGRSGYQGLDTDENSFPEISAHNFHSPNLSLYQPSLIRSPTDACEVGSSTDISRPEDCKNTPCLRGIANFGNSCYMNAVLQCIAVLSPFADCVKSLQLRTNDHVPTAVGHSTDLVNLIYYLVYLLKCMWNNERNEIAARNFRAAIGKLNWNYCNETQQDAQELLVWLLDKVHDGLLLLSNSSSFISRQRLTFRSSIITDTFGAEFSSSIECRSCSFTKTNFDPYICVSIQLPENSWRSLYVLVVFAGMKRDRLMRYGVNVDRGALIKDIQECICGVAHLPQDQVLIVELFSGGIRPLLSLDTPVSKVFTRELYAVQLPAPCEKHLDNIYIIFVFVVDDIRQVSVKYRLSEPFVCLLSQNASYYEISAELFGTVSFHRLNDSLLNYASYSIRAVDKWGSLYDLSPDLPRPLFSSDVVRIIANGKCFHSIYQSVLPLIVELREERENYLMRLPPTVREKVVDHPSCDLIRGCLDSDPVLLTDCLKEYVQPESIEWKCERCGCNRARKIMEFRSLPSILIFHLKRFKQMNDGSVRKLDRIVKFPVHNLDMSRYLNGRKHISVGNSFPEDHNFDKYWSHRHSFPCSFSKPYNRTVSPSLYPAISERGFLYDLVAVVHHDGSTINAGHYTATTKNPIDGKWRTFDDLLVFSIDSSEVLCTGSAYILFYERQPAHAAQSASDSRSRSSRQHKSDLKCSLHQNSHENLRSFGIPKGLDRRNPSSCCYHSNFAVRETEVW